MSRPSVRLLDPGRYLDILAREMRAAREELALSREELSALSGVHVNTIGALERAEHDISVITENRLVAALGLEGLRMAADAIAFDRAAVRLPEPRLDLLGLKDSAIVGSIGGSLRSIRRRQGLSLEALGEKIHVHRNTLWNCERGLVIPAGYTLYKVYRALGVDSIHPSPLGLGARLSSEASAAAGLPATGDIAPFSQSAVC